MRKRVGFLILSFIIFTLGFPLGAQGFKTLSVLYFTNTTKSADFDWLSKGLSDMLVSDLGASGKITIVEREELVKLIKEQEFLASGMADPASALEVGKILGADLLVYGSFVGLGANFRMDAKAVNPQTGSVVATASASGPVEGLLDLEKTLASRLATGLKLEGFQSSGGPTNLESVKTYYRGLSFLDSGDYQNALTLFSQAASLDPLYLKPGKGIEEAYKFLKDFKNQRYRREMNALASDIDALTRRITGNKFYSFADMATNPQKFGYADAAAASAAYKARPKAFAGDTLVQAIWNLQFLYIDLGGKAEEYFQDLKLKAQCQDKVLFWRDVALNQFPKDPFLPEVLYLPIFVLEDRGQWSDLRALCENLMSNYPDYRMMWAIEDAYERALEHLK